MSSAGFATTIAIPAQTASTAGAGAAAHATAAGAVHAVSSAAMAGATAAAGTVLVGAAAALGAGILIAQGLMWCGEKMEANYQEACQQWAAFENKLEAESRTNVEELSNYLTSQIEYMSISEFASVEPTAAATVNQQELEKTLARARTALKNTNTAETRAATERNLLIARLRAEIKIGRDILPPAILSEAETSLTGPTETIKATLERLDNAWKTINEVSALQTRTIQQTQQLLTLISAKLSAIDSMIHDTDPGYKKRLHQLYSQVQTARDELGIQPEQALIQATQAQQDTETLFEEISASVHKSWRDLRGKVNAQIGTLNALSQIIYEAEVNQLTHLFDGQKLEKLKERITVLKAKGKKLLDGNSARMRDDITRLTMAVENLKQNVFAEVETGQQSNIASLIQETLNELGFQSQAGEAPVIKRNGDITRVEVMVSHKDLGQVPPAATTTQRGDRLISFDITRNGHVSYDFGGYMDAECVKDAQKVFAALHKKGIYLINETAMRNLQGLSLEAAVKEIQQERSQVTPEKNKTQVELAEKVKGVLDQMGYQNIRVSSIGGSIEMEAFNGNTGYRVIMSPEGEIQIFDGQHTDITNKASDPVAKVSHEVQEESQETEVKKRKTSYMASRKGHMLSH